MSSSPAWLADVNSKEKRMDRAVLAGKNLITVLAIESEPEAQAREPAYSLACASGSDVEKVNHAAPPDPSSVPSLDMLPQPIRRFSLDRASIPARWRRRHRCP